MPVYPYWVEIKTTVDSTGVQSLLMTMKGLEGLMRRLHAMSTLQSRWGANMNQQMQQVNGHLERMAKGTGHITDATKRAHASWRKLHIGITATRLALMWLFRVATQGIIKFGKEAIKTADSLQRMEIIMTRFLGSTKAAKEQLAVLGKIAITSPFSLQGVMGLGSSLTVASPYFRNATNLQKSVPALMDLASFRSIGSGGKFTMEESMDVLNRNLVRFMVQTPGQMKGQYLGQLQKIFPIIPWRELKEKYGSDAGKIMEEITRYVFERGMKGMSVSFQKTWEAQWSNLKDYMLIGASQGMAKGRRKLIDAMFQYFNAIDMTKPLQNIGTKIGEYIGQIAGHLAKLIGTGEVEKKLGGMIDKISSVGEGLLLIKSPLAYVGLKLVGVSGAMEILNKMSDLAVIAINGVSKALGGMAGDSGWFTNLITGGLEVLTGLVEQVDATFSAQVLLAKYGIGTGVGMLSEEQLRVLDHEKWEEYQAEKGRLIEQAQESVYKVRRGGWTALPGVASAIGLSNEMGLERGKGLWSALGMPTADSIRKHGHEMREAYLLEQKQKQWVQDYAGNESKEKADALDRNTNALNRNTVKLQEVYDPLMVEGGSVE